LREKKTVISGTKRRGKRKAAPKTTRPVVPFKKWTEKVGKEKKKERPEKKTA